MGKRKPRRSAGIPIRIPIVEYEDGGIYWREKVVDEATEEWTQEL
jgi:hypothetical protein